MIIRCQSYVNIRLVSKNHFGGTTKNNYSQIYKPVNTELSKDRINTARIYTGRQKRQNKQSQAKRSSQNTELLKGRNSQPEYIYIYIQDSFALGLFLLLL